MRTAFAPQERLPAHAPSREPSWLYLLRAKAAQSFAAEGFPSPRAEEWQFTRIADLAQQRFTPVATPAAVAPPLDGWLLADAYRLVFVDGLLFPALSVLPQAAGIICDLAYALQEKPAQVERHFGRIMERENHGFIHFDTANFRDGVYLRLAAGSRLDRPLQIVHWGSTAESLAATRNLILLESGAEAEIVEIFLGGDSSRLSVSAGEILLGDNAHLTLTKLQCDSERAWHFGGNYLRQGKSSVFKHHNFAFGGLLARTEVHTRLDEGAACELNGLFVADGQRHLDNHVRVEHGEPRAVSRETYKGIATGHARGIFQGRVVVHEQAQKSDAAMNSRNLLLSAEAEIDAKPQLEIYADDVKCSHGVTVGQLDEESVFYLQSRGLSDTEARGLLTFAFANEMATKLSHAGMRALVEAQLSAKLAPLAPALQPDS
ncbi:MAG TPA: Fe-S cluster assembly protein SufD [Methylococcaceae bacterium]|nr:Fe-S cluster assembly protein SufD [Methylococcaceae bacterium]